MGTHIGGVLGGFKGKVGAVIGSRWRGKDVMRGRPHKSSKPPTLKQLNQQEKFRVTVGFLSRIKDLLDVTFADFAIGVTGYNAAISYNIQTAVTGTESPFNIDYTRVTVSRGLLLAPSTSAAEAVAGNGVKFTWDNKAGLGNGKDTDQVILVVYSPGVNQALYVFGGAQRSALTQTMDASLLAGETVETWLAFVNAAGTKVSDSMYTGTFNLLP